MQPWIFYFKLHETEYYRGNLKSGVNFQVMLKYDHAERYQVKRPPVQVTSHLFHSYSKCFNIDTTGKNFLLSRCSDITNLVIFLFCHAAMSRNTSLTNWILLGQLRNVVTRQMIKVKFQAL